METQRSAAGIFGGLPEGTRPAGRSRRRRATAPSALGFLVLFLSLAGVAERSTAGSVRDIDIREAPEMSALADRARRIADEVYPKIVELLADASTKPPLQFDIVFTRRLKSFAAGATRGTKISLSARWLARHPADLDQLLAHEMTHVAQKYRAAPFYWTRAPAWLEEGIAAYVPYKVGFVEGSWCPQCSSDFPHYTSGYSCAGAFLLYVDTLYGSNVVRRLNASLRQGCYSDEFFAETTGRSLEQLWDGFKSASGLPPGAALAEARSRATEDARTNRREALSVAPGEAESPGPEAGFPSFRPGLSSKSR